MHQLLAINIGDMPLGGGKTVQGTYPTFSVLVNIILKNSLTVIGIILVFLLIYGGLTYIISAGNGDQKKSQQAQGVITYALIGFAVVLLAYFIIQIIETVTGVQILNNTNL
jgi:TRAP-type C4-dicarboxylate transport system permease small subunit